MSTQPPSAKTPKPVEPRPSLRRRLFRWTERVLALIGLGFLVWTFGFKLTVITSGSMAPTLQGESWAGGDWVLTERISSKLRKPARWDLIHFRNNEGVEVMKRVVAFPGETVSIRGNSVVINGQPLVRPQSLSNVHYFAFGNLSKHTHFEVVGGYYVLGDFSTDSEDSRYEGPVSPGQIMGRPLCRVWPLARVGWVNP